MSATLLRIADPSEVLQMTVLHNVATNRNGRYNGRRFRIQMESTDPHATFQ